MGGASHQLAAGFLIAAKNERFTMSAPRRGGFVNAIIIFGYVITYLIGLVAGYLIIAKLLGIGSDGIGNGSALIVVIIGVPLFITAPLCAMGYHKILEKFDLESTGF